MSNLSGLGNNYGMGMNNPNMYNMANQLEGQVDQALMQRLALLQQQQGVGGMDPNMYNTGGYGLMNDQYSPLSQGYMPMDLSGGAGLYDAGGLYGNSFAYNPIVQERIISTNTGMTMGGGMSPDILFALMGQLSNIANTQQPNPPIINPNPPNNNTTPQNINIHNSNVNHND